MLSGVILILYLLHLEDVPDLFLLDLVLCSNLDLHNIYDVVNVNSILTQNETVLADQVL